MLPCAVTVIRLFAPASTTVSRLAALMPELPDVMTVFASVVTEMLPVLDPAVTGVKVIVIAQLAPAATELLHVFV